MIISKKCLPFLIIPLIIVIACFQPGISQMDQAMTSVIRTQTYQVESGTFTARPNESPLPTLTPPYPWLQAEHQLDVAVNAFELTDKVGKTTYWMAADTTMYQRKDYLTDPQPEPYYFIDFTDGCNQPSMWINPNDGPGRWQINSKSLTIWYYPNEGVSVNIIKGNWTLVECQ